MVLCFMTAVQDYTVHLGAKLTRVCHCLTAQVPSSYTCSEPYESIAHTHTHTHTHTIFLQDHLNVIFSSASRYSIFRTTLLFWNFPSFFYLGIIKTLLFRRQLCFGPQMVNCRVDRLRRAPVSHWAQ